MSFRNVKLLQVLRRTLCHIPCGLWQATGRLGTRPQGERENRGSETRAGAMEDMLYRLGFGGLTTVAGFMLAVCTPLAALAATQGSMTPKTIPEVRSHAYYILDESAASVLAARNEHTAVPIASITKLMTALVVLEAGQPMDQAVTITADDVRGTAGSGSRLAAGHRLSRQDLLHLALMSSENHAAQLLGRTYPGGLAAAVDAMNAKAQLIGMHDTHFADPTGLSAENRSSPVDLVKLVNAAYQHPVLRDYSTSSELELPIVRSIAGFLNGGGGTLLIGVAAIAGFPPFGVFTSEFLLLTATMQAQPWLTVALLTGLAVAFAGLFRHVQPMVYGAAPEGQQPVQANLLPVAVHLGLVLWLGLSIPGFLARWLDRATELITGAQLL